MSLSASRSSSLVGWLLRFLLAYSMGGCIAGVRKESVGRGLHVYRDLVVHRKKDTLSASAFSFFVFW